MKRVSKTAWRHWGRWGVALLCSAGLHVSLWLWAKPSYRPVRDVAVSMEILDGDGQQVEAPAAAGPRDATPEAPPVVADAPVPPAGEIVEEAPVVPEVLPPSKEPEAPEAVMPDDAADTSADDTSADDTSADDTAPDAALDTDSVAAPPPDTDTRADSDTHTDTGRGDTGAHATDATADTALASLDTAAARDSAAGTDSGADTGEQVGTPSGLSGSAGPGAAGQDTEPGGICLHDVFAWSKTNPSWVLWLAMDAFAGTAYEAGLAGVLGSFYLYNEMVQATGIKPLTELESVLIAADSFADFATYQVVTTYNVPQDVLVGRLQRHQSSNPRFTLKKTPQGVSGIAPGSYRWDFVGGGRVMVASDAAQGKFDRDWPQTVSCMAPLPAFSGDGHKAFARLVRSQIGPSPQGRWPVLLIATRDPDALGLGHHPVAAQAFQWAWVKGYFSDPPMLEGVVQFSPQMQDMEVVRRMVQRILAQGAAAKLVGLGDIAGRVKWDISGQRLQFAVPLTEAEIRIALVLLKTYSARLNRNLLKGTALTPATTPAPAPTPAPTPATTPSP